MKFDNKKIIIFDMDGVLFDTLPFARQSFMQTHPGITDEMYNELHSGNYHHEAAKYEHLMLKESEQERQKRYEAYGKKKSESHLFDGIKDLLLELHNAGYPLVLNTNAYQNNTIPLLKKSSIDNLFDFIATAETSKDKVEKFIMISDRYKVGGNEMLFVTDSLGDLRDADKANVPTVAVTWGVHDKTYFYREKYENLIGVVSTVKELKNAIIHSP